MDPLILTRENLTQLKQSERWVSFHAKWQDGELVESTITGKRTSAANDEYTHVILNPVSTIEYGSGLTREHSILRAYNSVSSPRFDDLWMTFLALARVGDELRVVWSANGHANSYVRDAHLNVDTCELEIRRPTKKDGRVYPRKLRFHLDFSICPGNTARMFSAGESGFGAIDGPFPHMLGGTDGPEISRSS